MKCDILIIGAGLAGITAAYLLQKQGKDVMLIDEHEFTEIKACSGVITNRTKIYFDRLFDSKVASVNYVVKRVVIRDSSDVLISNVLLDKPIYNIDLSDVIDNIKSLFISAGGLLTVGTRVTSVNDKIKTVWTSEKEAISYKFLIGADGSNSIIRKKLDKNCEPGGMYYMRDELVSDRQAIDIQRRRGSNGYMLSIPRTHYYTPDLIKVRSASILLGPIAEADIMLNRIGSYQMCTDTLYGAIPYGNVSKKFSGNGIFLIGNAAGLGDALLGYGIYYALFSAKAVSNALSCTGAEDEYYAHEIKSLQKEIDSQLYARKFLERVGGIRCTKRSIQVDRLIARLVTRYLTTGIVSKAELIALYCLCKTMKR